MEVNMSDLVTVFETGDPALVALAKSLLDSAGIEFATKGEALQDLLGLGRFPGGNNLVTGPVVFEVGPDDAEKARSMLRDLKEAN
jgi:putative signal transducing protein